MTDGDGTASADSTQTGRDETKRGRRDVVVPLRLYKTVTVFSTLIAVISVVVGFMFLDAATLNVSFVGALITDLRTTLGLSIADDVLSTILAVAGLAIIGFGAGVYILGTRFRAQGMGKSQEDSDEDSE
ncbi:hypothetical protein GL213_11795 [Halogeometricum borinquense]|uniref:DUF7315 domain-containing protein n=1 Tax=Halogeometricum borinquense TaxID=60847 RepID=A0A6C0UGR3_9EURY|nr:hypothetical protein [Halogeometricum borinquense]QIB73451.1 hypothetical protein G3I44_03615 [Halogeometricum borinquense]QIQ77147.1 hypothetical protein GL213_11795 [Halogeometricum borinquense]